MTRWVNEYPKAGHDDLLSRLQSKRQAQFDGAYFELFLYRLLTKVVRVTPSLPPDVSGASRFDFLVGKTGVEATVFEDVESESSIDSDGMDILRESTPKVRTPGFTLWLERFQRGCTEPSKKRVALLIDGLLNQYSREELLSMSARPGEKHDLTKLPIHTLADRPSGWSWTVRPIPLQTAEARPRSIVANSGEGKVVHVRTAERTRDAIKVKIEQHAATERPLVVAVCSNHWADGLGVDDVAEALLGSEYWQADKQGAGNPRPFRKNDGLWTNTRGALSKPAALIATSLCKPWVKPGRVMLWENPSVPAIDWLAAWPLWRCHWPSVPGAATIREGRELTLEEMD